MSAKTNYLILGNGPAGNRAALTLRDNDPHAGITIISDENIEFYYKPRLAQYVEGKIKSDQLRVNPLEFYAEKNIRLRLGQKVSAIDPKEKKVFFKHMEEIHYDGLIIASGSKARLLPSMAPFSEHLNFITSFQEAQTHREAIRSSRKVFLLGGDLVGFQFCKLFRSMGKEVTMLLFPEAFWPFNLTDDMLAIISDRLSDTGARVLAWDALATIKSLESGFKITTRAGVEISADMVFSFNGLIPRVSFARGSGLDIDHGFLVNEYMQTSVDNIYACGSCAQIYNPEINSYTTSIGWPNAGIQGEVAAMNLLGKVQKVKSAGRKYFDLEGVKIKTSWWEDIENEPVA